ncbi:MULTISPECIES: glycine cleavage system aminomethyltransferase GcvT [Alteribacter]|uniref:Aminomethyltransferase n=1 Tax=Alteribacter keqinensis TaxID=2483800 RepID=A0A3M7TTW2_9BACI|nr:MULTISPECIES: glycine cleavage system aminomethyltransferase GcvT [Alteribacter]MBM7097310.1 glycine cleavage system aminomethyltransferase GcvT [Alteribacter salitolerans]RNA68957.1 glycine cleavage system aminomethyltransferase GcvT [Alteribacter keqinensis]
MGNKTPLYDVYKDQAKTIDFGGWDLPVQFSSIKDEHEAVRTKAGLFDVSHMGEIDVQGNGAEAFLQSVFTNDVEKLKTGGCQYSAMCYENGGTVDDLVYYKRGEGDYLLVVNASNIEKDYNWLVSRAEGFENVNIVNVSENYAQIAIQGPLAEKVLQKETNTTLSDITFFKFRDGVSIGGVEALVSRTGYTGEDGFEIYCKPEEAATLWNLLLEAGKEEGIQPCGLGSRDTLRFEARLALYGQELTKDITPVEAGIGFAVKTDKEADFFGKEVLKEQKDNGPSRKLVGLEMIDKGIPRTDYEVFNSDGEKIGFVTTGTQSPTLKKNVGLAIIDKDFTAIGTEVEVQVRKRRLKAVVAATPFYKKSN